MHPSAWYQAQGCSSHFPVVARVQRSAGHFVDVAQFGALHRSPLATQPVIAHAAGLDWNVEQGLGLQMWPVELELDDMGVHTTSAMAHWV